MNARSLGAWLGLFLWWAVPLQADPNLIVDLEQALPPPVIDGDVGDWNGVRWLRFAPGAPVSESAQA